MAVLSNCKLQLGCLMALVILGILYFLRANELNKLTQEAHCKRTFDFLFAVAGAAVLFDGITACTVNYTDTIPRWVNLILYACMYISYEAFLAILYSYCYETAVGIPTQIRRGLIFFPCGLCAALTLALLPGLKFVRGTYANYSMGASVYVCFACVGMYSVMTLLMLWLRRRNIEKQKLRSFWIALGSTAVLFAVQIIFPQYLLASLAVMMVTVVLYINMENPDVQELEHYHREMITGFATLIDNKDDSTGGHVVRSSAYAQLIARNLRRNPKYVFAITGDFLYNLNLAAPMHDVGKIGIPDAILQKPGRLTNEEFEKMKEHPVIGARIIRQSFSRLGRGEYMDMAYDIALHHHEKWNGKGYPDGMSGETIPLSARIMAVADVFDAVSAKRCYRDAMPLEECYEIIQKGRGTDFDPDMVDAFLLNRDAIETIYHSVTGKA